MSRWRNGTNRAGKMLNVNKYTRKVMQKKKKSLTEVTEQAQVTE